MALMQTLRGWGLAIACLGSSLSLALPAGADEFPNCGPPDAGEYLLLVRGETVDARDRIQNLLPTATSVSICSYLNAIVVRAGGFTSLENANAWAQYLTEIEGAEAFVARPAVPGDFPTSPETVIAEPVETPAPEAPTSPVEPVVAEPEVSSPTEPRLPSEALNGTVAYAPQLLGEGYAVLVDYNDDPAVAQQLQQTLNMPVGLAVYGQEPFLLAVQSPDPQAAAQVLQTLSGDRFGAFIVDSSEVVLLSSGVAIP